MLSGYKTYLSAAGIILTAVGGFMHGDLTLVEAITTALAGLGLGSLRAGVSKGPSS